TEPAARNRGNAKGVGGGFLRLTPSPSPRAVVLRVHARALDDWPGRPRPLELGDDEPAYEIEGSYRALCCSSIPFGAVALKVLFRPSGLALLRRELRLRTRGVRACSLGLSVAFRSIDLNGRRLRTSFARVRARVLVSKLSFARVRARV